MIVVTGSAGLLGAEVVRQLCATGKPVRALYNHTQPEILPLPNLEFFQCDILDVVKLNDAMSGADLVYHCAGLVSFSPTDRERLVKINVEGTSNVVNAALEAGVKKVVHVSSVAALGRMDESRVLDEKMEWTEQTNGSIYGQTKYLGEREVWRGIAEGLNAVIVNPVVILGPGNWDAGSVEIFRLVYNGFPWYSEGTTGFVDVRDTAAAMIALMNSGLSAERFIISAGNFSFHEIFDGIADGFGVSRPARRVTPFMAAMKWRLDALAHLFGSRKPAVTQETARTALAKVRFDASKFAAAFPEFSYRPMADTLSETCAALAAKYINAGSQPK